MWFHRGTRRDSGISLIEVTIVGTITVVVFAVSMPFLLTTLRTADLRTAQTEMAGAIRRASEMAATGGARVDFNAQTVSVPKRVVINPQNLRYIPGALISDSITFQGGTGYPWVSHANQTAAVILADEADVTKAVAVVVGPSGTVKRMVLKGAYLWEVER
jgi:type II secretory pathway pseudopilin PulG